MYWLGAGAGVGLGHFRLKHFGRCTGPLELLLLAVLVFFWLGGGLGVGQRCPTSASLRMCELAWEGSTEVRRSRWRNVGAKGLLGGTKEKLLFRNSCKQYHLPRKNHNWPQQKFEVRERRVNTCFSGDQMTFVICLCFSPAFSPCRPAVHCLSGGMWQGRRQRRHFSVFCFTKRDLFSF